jgi:hypothetical protein
MSRSPVQSNFTTTTSSEKPDQARPCSSHSQHRSIVDDVDLFFQYIVTELVDTLSIRIGLVARICRSQSSKGDQFRQGRGSIPRFGIISFVFAYPFDWECCRNVPSDCSKPRNIEMGSHWDSTLYIGKLPPMKLLFMLTDRELVSDTALQRRGGNRTQDEAKPKVTIDSNEAQTPTTIPQRSTQKHHSRSPSTSIVAG